MNDIGSILYRQRKFTDAMEFHQQTLEIQEAHYTSEHSDIFVTLIYISNILL